MLSGLVRCGMISGEINGHGTCPPVMMRHDSPCGFRIHSNEGACIMTDYNELELSLQNYRCFSMANRAQLRIGPGCTAIVGPNNSGKTSILRSFFELRRLYAELSKPQKLYNVVTNGVVANFEAERPIELFNNANQEAMRIRMRVFRDPPLKWDAINIKITRDTNKAELTITGKNDAELPLPTESEWSIIGNNVQTRQGDVVADLGPITTAFRDLAQSMYIPAFRHILRGATGPNQFDIEVGEPVVKKWSQLKFGANSEQRDSCHEVTDEIRQLLGFDQLSIDASDDKTHLQLRIDGRSYRLDEVGAGTAQVIVVLFMAALRKPKYVFIDEPELNLHPTLQVDFVRTLAKYAERGIVFATHSYGLARSLADRLFTCSMHERHVTMREVDRTPRLSELMGVLSYGGYTDIGYNKVLLVEGVTEVLTIRELMRTLDASQNVLLIPLGGTNLICGRREQELAEMVRIIPNPECGFALIDSEKKGPNDQLKPGRQSFATACKNLRIRCHVLERRATENYFPSEATKKIVNVEGLGPYDEPKAWPKNHNAAIAREMDRESLLQTDLGKFLSTVLQSEKASETGR